ncbi:MAG: serine/threonine protein kinase [Akkermansiaceae bacterium]|nr:serine/threonine protein kinase [Akkermansiaceae bacterium]
MDGTWDTASLQPGDFPRITGYALLERIGEGGCGDVYLAERLHAGWNEVALKVLKPGMDSRLILRRFEAERQALGRMNHEGIVPIVDSGMTEEGRPFFTMEYVRGTPVTEYCEGKGFGVRERLGIFLKICDAIRHAHQKGLIHRDIKPTNILVTEENGEPAARVIDFGISKAVGTDGFSEATLYTALTGFVGTPGYMSPEQIGLGSDDVDTRSDVYSLGILLYELLTGSLPHLPGKSGPGGIEEMRRVLLEQAVVAPSVRIATRDTRRAALVRGDLDAITLKALETDRDLRYESATALAQDIDAWLRNLPITARKPGRAYLFGKFIRRHRTGVAVSAGFLLVVIGASVFSTISAIQAKRSEREARRHEQKALVEAAKSYQAAMFLSSILQGVTPSIADGADTTLLKSILDNAASRIDREISGQPDLEAYLKESVGWAYHRIGKQKEAEKNLRRAIDIYRTLPEGKIRLAIDLNWLGYAIMSRDQEEAAIPAREGFERMLALADDPSIPPRQLRPLADTVPSIALILKNSKKPYEAEKAVRRWMEFQIRILGENCRSVAASHSAIGQNILQQKDNPDRLKDAEKHYLKAHDILSRLYGERHAETLRIRGNLGSLLLQQARLEEAEPLIRSACEDSGRILGEDHPEHLLPLLRLASLERRTGNLNESAEALRATAALRSANPSHRLEILDNEITTLARLFKERGEPEKALELLALISTDDKDRNSTPAPEEEY